MVLIINTFPFAEACHARFDGPNCPREIPNPTRRNAPRAISNPTRRKSPSGNSNTARLRLVVFELPSGDLRLVGFEIALGAFRLVGFGISLGQFGRPNPPRATQIPLGFASGYLSCPRGIWHKFHLGNSNNTWLRLMVFELPSWNLWSNTSSILRRSQGIYNKYPSALPRGICVALGGFSTNLPRATQIPLGSALGYLS